MVQTALSPRVCTFFRPLFQRAERREAGCARPDTGVDPTPLGMLRVRGISRCSHEDKAFVTQFFACGRVEHVGFGAVFDEDIRSISVDWCLAIDFAAQWCITRFVDDKGKKRGQKSVKIGFSPPKQFLYIYYV